MALLEVRDLSKRFQSRRGLGFRKLPGVSAVRKVSFSLKKHRTLCLVGESGCGKSTVCLLILGIYAADGGSVFLDGEDILRLSESRMRRVRKRMQPVFQDPLASLNPRRRVGALVEEPLVIHTTLGSASRATLVGELLERVGLSVSLASRFPHELSGGQRQRVALARALACSPDVLILDEPLSNLDVSVQAQIVNLIKDCQEELGAAMLFVSHDLRVVRQVADTVCVMHRGRIVEMAEVEAFFARPIHPYSRLLFEAQQTGLGLVQREEAPPVEDTSGCGFSPWCLERDEKCEVQAPELRRTKEGRFVACFRFSNQARESPHECKPN